MSYKITLRDESALIGHYDEGRKIFIPYGENRYYKSSHIKEVDCDECMRVFSPLTLRCPAIAYRVNNCSKQNTEESKALREKLRKERKRFVLNI